MAGPRSTFSPTSSPALVTALALCGLVACSDDDAPADPASSGTSGSGGAGGSGSGGQAGAGGKPPTPLAWSEIDNPTDAPLDRVAGSAPDDVWVLGPVSLARWDGSQWTSVDTGSALLVDVWSAGAEEARVLTTEPAGVLHGSGSDLPPDNDWDESVTGIAHAHAIVGSAANDVWVGTGWADGEANIHHWNGSTWSDVGTGADEEARDLWITSSDVWAVIATGPRGNPPSTEKLGHYQDGAWDFDERPGVLAVWASGPNDAWAVGRPGYNLHHDGYGWAEYSAGTPDLLIAVWGTAPDDVWAVGENAVVHWDGKSWELASGAPPGGRDIWGSSPSDVWIVSSDGSKLYHLAPAE